MTVANVARRTPAWLLKYLERGFRLVFYPTKVKGPVGSDAAGWTTRIYTLDDYREGDNVGVMTGHEIQPGKFVVDIDFDWPDGLPMVKRLLPLTNFGFGRDSRLLSHAFYTTSFPVVSKAFDDPVTNRPFVELRGAKADGSLGFQTMLPPSIHPSGEQVVLRADGEITHDDTVVRRVTLYAIACLLMAHLGHRGLLHDVRLAVAGFLLQLGLTEEEVITVGEAVAAATGNDVQDVAATVRCTSARLREGSPVTGRRHLAEALGEHGHRILRRAAEWLGVPAGGEFPLTEVGDAECFAASNADRVRYDHRRQRWLMLDETGIWTPDRNEGMRRLALDAMRQRQRDALTIHDTEDKRKALSWTIQGESTKRINNTLREARALPPLADDGDNWDTNPFLLGAPNGVIDLRTGALRHGTSEDRITMRVRVPLEPDAQCPIWEATLDQVFAGDRDLIDFIQRAMGYSSTGDCREECFFVTWGEGGNGKGTVMNTIAWVMGDYADDLPFSALELRERSSIPSDIAKLDGRRFVTASESGETSQFNVARIKP